jgi:hypothetical protein
MLRFALQAAFKHYMRTRDYCTTGHHIIHMCLQGEALPCRLQLLHSLLPALLFGLLVLAHRFACICAIVWRA